MADPTIVVHDSTILMSVQTSDPIVTQVVNVPGINGLKGDKGDKGDPGEKGDKGDPGDVSTGGTTDHAALSNLDFASSGHTGFMPSSATQDNVPDGTNYKRLAASDKERLAGTSGTNTGDVDISVKVDKVTGKGLSTEDFTTGEKTKLGTLFPPAGSDSYVQFKDGEGIGGDASFEYDKTDKAVKIGQPVLLPGNPLAIRGNVDGYLQTNLQNIGAGANGSADHVITADLGNDSEKYADFGISNSGYANETWDVVGPYDTYLFGDGGNVVVGSLSEGKKVSIFVAQTEHEGHPSDVIAEFDNTGVNLTNGGIYKKDGSDILTPYKNSLHTGILTRGVISINTDTTKIDITAGASLYVDMSDPSNPIIETLSWGQQTGLTPPSLNIAGRLWIGIQRIAPNTGGFVYSTEFTALEKRTIAILGRVWGNGSTVVEGIGQYATPAWGGEKTLEDLMRALGSINVTGNIFSPNGANLTLDKTSGQTFRFSGGSGVDMNAANILTDAVQTGISAYHYHLCANTSGFTILEADIDPEYYDNAGIKTAVTSSQFTIQRVYYFPKSGVIDIGYGQAIYATMSDAQAAVQTENYIVSTNNATTLYGSIIRAWIIVKQGTTDLTDTSKCKIITATNLGAGGASSGGSSVIPATTVTTQVFGDTGVVGASDNYAREDHKHAMMVAPTLATISDDATHRTVTDTEKTKLAGIASGAEVNVNADWNAGSGDAQILNKPTIPTALADLSSDSTHRIVTDVEKTTWNGKQPAMGSDDNYVTDAEKVVIGNTSNTNSGDNATNSQYSGLAASKESVSNKATTFGIINDTLYPTVKAVNDAITSAVVGLLDYRGSFDASTNLFPATGGSGTVGAVLKGDFWTASVAGTLGGKSVAVGDLIIALVDTPAQTATNWDLIEHDLGFAPEAASNKVTSVSGASTDVQYPSAKLLYDQLATKQATGTYSTDIHGNIAALNVVSGTNTGDNATNSQYSGLATSKENTGVAAGLDTTHAALTTGVHGAGANSFVYSNDSRLSDARTPVAHNQSATTITSGTLDGDRLPGLSSTKAGGVPATGTPSGKYLRDDGIFATPPGRAGATITEVEIDFGTMVSPNTSMIVTDASVSAINKILVFPSPTPATGRLGNDWELDSALFTALAGTGQFILSFVSNSRIVGPRNICYQII